MSGRQKAFLAGLVAAVLVVAAVLLWPDPKQPAAAPPPPTPSPTPTPSPSPSKTYPYAFFAPGTCLLAPWVRDSPVDTYTPVPCEQPHDSETIGNAVLPEGLTDDHSIIQATLELCKAEFTTVKQRQDGGGPYVNSPLVPLSAFYRQGYRDVSCAVTVRVGQEPKKMTGPLHP
ncbi:septum formation family protein [Kitasatospora sp. NPDC001540]|uniref:septum formation family protein n=1 Tax=Kitasatospora sp. NPDC001540 TaxID=3364014 RepID=UPI00368E35E5